MNQEEAIGRVPPSTVLPDARIDPGRIRQRGRGMRVAPLDAGRPDGPDRQVTQEGGGTTVDARKIIKATAGMAAATGVVVAAARKFVSTTGTSDDDANVFHVTPDGDAWTVSEVGDDGPGTRLETKRQALKEGRKLARRRKPSRLVVHRSDGTIQRQHSYGIDD